MYNLLMENTKVCRKCGVRKNHSEFYANKRNTGDGLNSYCKECLRKKSREYSTTGKGKLVQRKANKRYYHDGGGKEKSSERAKTEEAKEKSRKSSKRYYHERGGKEKQRERALTPERKEAQRESRRRWYYENGGREKQKELNKQEKHVKARAEYMRTSKGKEIKRQSYLKRRANDFHKIQAMNKVNNAVAKGDLPRIGTQVCTECGEQASDYHHFSYDEDHWLDVVPYCHDCHMQLHTEL